MSVSQRADGRWIVKYKDDSGKWKQRSEKDEATARAIDFELHQEQAEDRRLCAGQNGENQARIPAICLLGRSQGALSRRLGSRDTLGLP